MNTNIYGRFTNFVNNSSDKNEVNISGNLTSNNTYGYISATGTAQSLPNTVLATLDTYWDTVPILSGQYPPTYANGIFTLPTDGVYIASFDCFILTGNGERTAYLLVDSVVKGATIEIRNTASGNGMNGSAVFRAQRNSTVRVQVLQNSGGILNTSSIYDAEFAVYKIG